MGKYFGTDGFRGEANVNLTVEHAYKVGRFLGWYYGKQAKGDRCRVVIGKDTRRSSYMFEYSLAAGLTASGADTYLLHVTTTPSVSHVIRTEDFDCGIMISASHNPYYDNGIKVMNGNGEKLEESVIEEIEKYLDGEMEEIPLAKRENIGRTQDFAAGRNRYIGYLISIATRSFKGKKVGLDCSNGSASSVAKSVFDALGADTYVINDQPDGVNINMGCGSTHIEGLQLYVREHHLDVGFAFDGDADRCLLVDEQGGVIDGDKVLAVCGSDMKRRGKLSGGTIVATVMSNLGLHEFCRENGVGLVCTSVGDRNVLERMLEKGYAIGGEQSGHTIFTDYATTGDGQLTALQFLDVLARSGKKASELASVCPQYPQVLLNVAVSHERGVKDAIMASDALSAAIAEEEGKLSGEGRVLVRPSGTEALIRVMVEAKTEQIALLAAENLVNVIKML